MSAKITGTNTLELSFLFKNQESQEKSQTDMAFSLKEEMLFSSTSWQTSWFSSSSWNALDPVTDIFLYNLCFLSASSLSAGNKE